MRQVVVEITPAGSIKVDAKGFKGNECAKATEHIELVLGGIAKKTKKPEFFASPSTAQANKLTF